MNLFLALVIGGAVSGGLWFAIFRHSTERRAEDLDAALATWDLHVDPQTRTLLERHYLRRNRIGSVSGGVGAASGFAIGLLMERASPSITGVDATFTIMLGQLAYAAGSAASAMKPVNSDLAQHQLASLQPHGLKDYLPAVTMASEIALIVVGACMAVAGLWWRPPSEPGWALGAGGALMSVACAVVVAMQRQLVRIPQRADDLTRLAANDIMLVTGLRDLATVCYLAAMSGIGVVAFTARSEHVTLIGLAVLVPIVLMLCLTLIRPFGESSAPVAHQLAARQEIPA